MRRRRDIETEALLRVSEQREAATKAIAKQLSEMVLRKEGERKPEDIPTLETVKLLDANLQPLAEPSELDDEAD